MTLLLLACAEAPRPAPTGPPNVLLVSLDTVRADHTSVYGYGRDTTPGLAALAAGGTVFENAFSNGNESAWSHAALFTGRFASELASPVYETYGIPPGVALVSEALQASGYATGAFSAGGHVTGDFGFDQGWDLFTAQPSFGSLYDTGPLASAWIAAVPEGKPWFAFLHGYDAHRPYKRPGPWDHLYAGGRGSPLAEAICRSPCLSEMVLKDVLFPELAPAWFTHAGGAQIMASEAYDRLATAGPEAQRVGLTAEDRAHIVAHYDGAIRYTDSLLGVTLAQLEAAGKLDNTVVIVVSDHGEDLLDHGYMNHRTGLYDSCTRVPLVVWGPGFEGGKRVDGLVDGRDVAATIAALAGVMPGAGSKGRDLRSVARGEGLVDATFAEGVMDQVSVRTLDHRLVYRGSSLADPGFLDALRTAPLDGDQFELYALATDPGETTPVQDPVTMGALRDRLVAWRAGLSMGDYELPQGQVSPEVAASLREHGYWGDAAPSAPVAATGTAAAPVALEPVDAACVDRLPFLDAP